MFGSWSLWGQRDKALGIAAAGCQGGHTVELLLKKHGANAHLRNCTRFRYSFRRRWGRRWSYPKVLMGSKVWSLCRLFTRIGNGDSLDPTAITRGE